jgi:hypothetical protein
MFKFYALITGHATAMAFTTLLTGVTETCLIEFNLFSFSENIQIGNTFIWSFSSIDGNGINKVSTTVNITNAKWSMTNGSLYYLMIQTFRYNTMDTPCIVFIPYNIDKILPPKYAVTVIQGSNNRSRQTTSLSPIMAVDDGYIHMNMMDIQLSIALTPSVTLRPSVSVLPTPTSSRHGWRSLNTPSVTPTSTYTFVNVITKSNTPSATPTFTYSFVNVIKKSNTSLQTPSYTPTINRNITKLYIRKQDNTNVSDPITPLLNPSDAINSTQMSYIVGGVLLGTIFLISLTLLSYLIHTFYRRKYNGFRRQQSNDSSVITINPANQPVVYYNPV